MTPNNVSPRLLGRFAADYFAARKRFTSLGTERGAHLHTYPIRARGPGDAVLTIDSAYFGGPTPERLLIVSSGIHGAEGIAGSILQQQLVDSLPDPLALPEACGVLLVHAVNPYGFAYVRRANENNVDLNRNCLERFPGPVNRGYDKLAALLNPPSSASRADAFTLRLLQRGLVHGPRTTVQAIAGGQYHFPKGLFYGGRKQEESITVFEQVLRRTTFSRVRVALHIDIHTGLGPYASCQLLSQLAKDSPEWRQLQQWFGTRNVASSRSARAGAYVARGLIGELTARVLGHARVHALTLEFGTYALLKVLRLLRLENRLHHYGAPSSAAERKIKSEFLECFCPSDPRWRQAVLEQGGDVLKRAQQALAGTSLE
ncbi:MAG: DUF2817 domain-containing protein [Acidiferrobacterales bacterium]